MKARETEKQILYFDSPSGKTSNESTFFWYIRIKILGVRNQQAWNRLIRRWAAILKIWAHVS